jgi:decaprenyl-phosphate phosphoribosyltransferase
VALPPIVRAARPHQWLKNVLVIAAPLAAGTLLRPASLLAVALAFVVFCAASSGIYLVNDVLDVEADRAHPKKRFRPIASGQVRPATATALAVVLLVAAPAVSLLNGWQLAVVVVVYEAIQLAYCFWLKHVVVLDIVIVSSGFLIRAIAGAVAVGVPTSQWFLLVMSFGSLFMVAGKRYAEKLAHEDGGGATRRSLVGYSLSYLRFAWQSAAALALITYCLWAFELGEASKNIWAELSIVPFGIAILRYAYNVDKGVAGAPEDTVLEDRQLQILGALWVAVFAVSVVVR